MFQFNQLGKKLGAKNGFFQFYDWQMLCKVVMLFYTKTNSQFFHFNKSWTL
jgi:hypothetical protein